LKYKAVKTTAIKPDKNSPAAIRSCIDAKVINVSQTTKPSDMEGLLLKELNRDNMTDGAKIILVY